jgi:lipid-binding SYLF domain-containing protein
LPIRHIGYNPQIATHQIQPLARRNKHSSIPGNPFMKMSSAIRAAVLVLTALAGMMFSSASHADEGFIQLTIYKAGWIIGGSGGSGSLTFRGRTYSLSTGGLDYGLVFGAAGAGLAIGRGARAIVLTNQKGAVLELSGHQTGLMANADLSGLAITMR